MYFILYTKFSLQKSVSPNKIIWIDIMENNPKRQMDRIGISCRPEKTGITGRTSGKGAGKTGVTAYDRLNKALAVYEIALANEPG